MNISSRCVNCAVKISRVGRNSVNDLSDASRELLASWISPIKLLPEHMMCRNCFIIVETQSEAEEPIKAFGHKTVCLGCGVSLLRKSRCINIDQRTPEIDIISSWVPEIQISQITQACISCWLRANRRLTPKDEKLSGTPSVEKPCVLVKLESPQLNDDPLESSVRIKEELEDLNEEEIALRVQLFVPDNAPDENGCILLPSPTTAPPSAPPSAPPGALVVPEEEREESIRLPVYKRVSNTSNRCLSSQCTSTNRTRISDGFKQKMLVEHKIYIPKLARICSAHSQNHYNADWCKTLGEKGLLNNFNADHIEDMMSILTNFSTSLFNLEDVEKMNGPLRDFWLGVTPKRFYEIIEKCPSLKKIRNYKSSLALYLAKLRTGYTTQRMSSTFGIPRTTLQNRLIAVQNCLKEDNVSWDLGVGRIVEKPVRCVIDENELMSDDDMNMLDE